MFLFCLQVLFYRLRLKKQETVDTINQKEIVLSAQGKKEYASWTEHNGNVKPEEVKAKYESGVLTIALPKEDARKCSSCNTITIE